MLGDLGRKLQSALSSLNSTQPIDKEALDKILKSICAALLESDINVHLVKSLRANVLKSLDTTKIINTGNKRKFLQQCIFDQLVALVQPAPQKSSDSTLKNNVSWKPKKGKKNVVMFVGLQGSGKTTTCTKLAHYYQRKNFKVGLVCTDTFRAGAFDQLKQNATKANIPFYGSYTESDPVQLAMDGVEKFKSDGFELIIVDTSGRHKQEQSLFDEMAQIKEVVEPDNVIFVMDGTIGQAAELQAKAFKETIPIGSIILTKMDGHAKGGGALSAVAATGSNIIFIGTGEHIHELESFDPRRFIGKMLGMGDMTGLLETVQDLNLEQQNPNLLANLSAGVFTLRNMRDQLSTISSMGPLSKVMGMMPGMPQEMLSMADDDGANGRMKMYMCIMDSMTDKELDSDGKIFLTPKSSTPGSCVVNSRMRRIALGSGTSIRTVEELLMQSQKFAQMVKTMGGSKGLLSGLEKAKKGGNPQDAMGKLQAGLGKMLPPGMLEQMGGMSGVQSMMQQMGGMEGMMQKMGGVGGMAEMMQKMGLGGQASDSDGSSSRSGRRGGRGRK